MCARRGLGDSIPLRLGRDLDDLGIQDPASVQQADADREEAFSRLGGELSGRRAVPPVPREQRFGGPEALGGPVNGRQRQAL